MIGSSVTQTPTASKTAAAIAGGCGLFAISPIPFAPYGPSADGFSMMTVSTCGRSSMPGREVRAELPAAMLDGRVVRVAVLEHAEPEALHGAALDLALDQRRVDRPADVVALDEPRHASRSPVSSSTSTSAAHAAYEIAEWGGRSTLPVSASTIAA